MRLLPAKYVLIAPPLAFFLALSLIPLLLTLALSLTSADLSGHGSWVGLSNYHRLFDDPIFIRGYVNTLEYAAFGVPIQYVLGLALAPLVWQVDLGGRFLR